MGIKDLFSGLKDLDASEVMTKGIIGASISAKQRKLTGEAEARPKPGKYCSTTCTVSDDRCTECMRYEKDFIASVKRLEKLEELNDKSTDEIKQELSKRAVSKCSLCGAPHESGKSACPFCRTEYPEDCIDFDVPLSASDRKAVYMDLIQKTWTLWADRQLMIIGYNKANMAAQGKKGIMSKFVNSFSGMMEKHYPHTNEEILQGAEHYKVPVSEYIMGVATGQMKTTKILIMEENNRRMEEESRRRNEMMAQQQAQRAAGSSYTAMDYLQKRSQNSSYGYSGGADRYCGNCMYFWGGNQCTNGGHTNSASDYCALWRLK